MILSDAEPLDILSLVHYIQHLESDAFRLKQLLAEQQIAMTELLSDTGMLTVSDQMHADDAEI